jgi:hypothetical protein
MQLKWQQRSSKAAADQRLPLLRFLLTAMLI